MSFIIMIDEYSSLSEFKFTVPLLTKFPDKVRSLSRFIVSVAELFTVTFLATAPEFEES